MISRGKFRNLLTGITVSVISIFFFLLVTELVSRLVYPEIILSANYDWRSRHEEYPLEKPPDTFRIVVLGDSYTFGQGVAKEDTFPKKLELLLNKYSKGNKFEVINLGFCGLNTIREFEVLTERGINPATWLPDERYKGLAYHPDLILIEYTLNDTIMPARTLELIKPFDDRRLKNKVIRINSGPYALPLPEVIDRLLSEKSRFYIFLINRYNQVLAKLGLREEGDIVKDTLNRYKEGSVGWAYIKQALAEVSSFAKRNKLPLIALVIYPDMIDFDNYPFKDVHEKVQRVANILGFHTLDLLPAFKGMDAKSLWATPVDGHPGARAHEIAAKAIFEYLREERLIPL